MTLEAALWEYAEASTPAAVGGGARAFSPLGAWLMRAALAGATESGQSGGSPLLAVEQAASVLGTRPGLTAALAVWLDDPSWSASVREWVNGLPPEMTTGAIPSKEAADAWVAAQTAGRIASLPLGPDKEAILHAVTALSVLERWDEPLGVVPAASRRGWFADLSEVLLADDARIVDSGSQGLAGITRSLAGPIAVYSVIGTQLPAESAARAALAIVRDVCDRGWSGLPSADAPRIAASPQDMFTVEEGFAHEPGTTVHAHLPCWRVESEIVDLTNVRAFGMAELVDGLIALAVGPVPGVVVQQALTAAFNQTGFSATAVTEMGLAGSGPPDTPHTFIAIEYCRPYTVVVMWRDLPILVVRVTEIEEPPPGDEWEPADPGCPSADDEMRKG